MRVRTIRQLTTVIAAASVIVLAASAAVATNLSPKQSLGKQIFFDTSLSTPNGQGCVSCHDPEAGFADPDRRFATSNGAIPFRFGNRNAPTVTYLATAPDFTLDRTNLKASGGFFLDGRAATLSDQAKQPFLNPLEMNNPSPASVVQSVLRADYGRLFRQVYGNQVLIDKQYAYNAIADALAEFQHSSELNKFNSKFDLYLNGKSNLTTQESAGLALFTGKAKCFGCHKLDIPAGDVIFTNFGYANVGPPANDVNPFYFMPPQFNPDGFKFVDYGLGGFLRQSGEPESVYTAFLGKFNIPTLRNIARTAPYFHNGVFRDLGTLVHFFNTRDVPGAGPAPGIPWPPSEVRLNVSTTIGNLGLTSKEESQLVAFLNTLTDDYGQCQH